MKPIYLDNAATTAPDKEILHSAVELLSEDFYNPSAGYREGRGVRNIVEESREKILKDFKKRKLNCPRNRVQLR